MSTHYATAVRQWFGHDGELDYREIDEHFGGSEMFYYDCLDDQKKVGESDAVFDERFEAAERHIDGIPAHIRLGYVIGKASPQRPRRQKQVDVLLAVDMLKHAVRQNMFRAVLVTGDADFEPVVDALVDLGVHVILAGDKNHTSRHLIRAASEYQPLTFLSYFKWSDSSLREHFPVPQRQEGVYNPGAEPLAECSLAGHPCQLYRHAKQGCYILTVPRFDRDSFTLVHDDFDGLKRFCLLEYGQLDELRSLKTQ